MGIKDFLFGKEKIITDNKLGFLKARIKNTNPSINYVWASETLLSGQAHETVIILEGNAEGPFKAQLESAYLIVDSIDDLAERISKESKKHDKINYNGDWIKNFYLSAITPMDLRDNSFEVNFEPKNHKENGCVLFTWKNNQIYEIEIR